jgi:hypothetical protein
MAVYNFKKYRENFRHESVREFKLDSAGFRIFLSQNYLATQHRTERGPGLDA